RCVQVNASCYGLDNSVTRYALDECRANGVAARGVATIHPEIGYVELEELARGGFVGARLMPSRIGSLGLEAFEEVANGCLPNAGFKAVARIVKLFARDFPDRLMWGSNLPHPGLSGGAPDDLELIGAAPEWLPDSVARQRVFADNAERFYGL